MECGVLSAEKSCVEVIERFRSAQIEDGKSELTAKTMDRSVLKP